jgi:hypothetical protein
MSGSGNSMLGFKNLPEDHPMRRTYRIFAAVVGLVLIGFGILGLVRGVGFLSTGDETVLGMGTNGLLSLLSIAVGAVLIGGAVVDGNVDAYVNALAGIVFMVAGLASLAFLRTSYNYLNFDMWNVIFSFVVGMILFAAGLYGRVSE